MLPFVESLVRDGFGGMVEQVNTLCPSHLDWRLADFFLQAIYLDNLSNSIRIGPKQLPHLYDRYVRQLVLAKLAPLWDELALFLGIDHLSISLQALRI